MKLTDLLPPAIVKRALTKILTERLQPLADKLVAKGLLEPQEATDLVAKLVTLAVNEVFELLDGD